VSTETTSLPLTETVTPADEDALAEQVADCFQQQLPVYPLGGCTSQDYGLPPRQEGIGLSLAGLDRLVDFPARDLTVTVEAGISMATLAEQVAAEGLQLPVHVPAAEQATIGGVIATNWNGPARPGYGTIRDYVIGISAVDGKGLPFRGGGRVVKNVAGYDFCKLLTGSLGTLGVITQVTLRLKPIPARATTLVVPLDDLDQAEQLLCGLVDSQATPYAVELLSGDPWQDAPGMDSLSPWHLAISCCGTEDEVGYMVEQLAEELAGQSLPAPRQLDEEEHQQLWRELVEFSACQEAPLVIQATMVPSGTTPFIRESRQLDPACSIQAHAGSGIVIVRFSEFPSDGLSRILVATLQPAAAAAHGNVVILSNPSGLEMTARSTWGSIPAPLSLLSRIKNNFDPGNVLNPGRFVYP
jgi:glycolate oxidase FAD binding subunit